MAVSRPSTSTTSTTEWMMHPAAGIVFKSFDEPIIKSPFTYGSSPHIVPEKITECFVDPNNIRCYRVKWVDSWLTEQHLLSVFPNLITEYWINKPINDNLDYQPLDSSSVRNIGALEIPSSPSATTVKQVNKPSSGEVVTTALQSTSESTTITVNIPQVTPVFENQSTKNANETTGEKNIPADFTVCESLKLPEKVPFRENSNEALKTDEIQQNKENGEIPATSHDEPLVLLSKNGEQPVINEERDKVNPNLNLPFSKIQSNLAQPVSSFENQIHITQNGFQYLTSFDPLNQLNQQLAHQVQHLPVAQEAKPKKNPTLKSKPKQKEPVVCDLCGKTIASKKNLRMHKIVKHFKNGSFECEICNRKFALKRDLKRHMPFHTNERNYVCKFCGLLCKQPGHLTKHMRTHTEVMNWRCDCCFKTFRVQADLKEHCFTEHKDVGENNVLECSVCKEKLKLPNSVYRHSLRHSGVRDFKCNICDATFKLKQHMQCHMKTHQKPETPVMFPCRICGKEFRSKLLCERHAEKHSEKSPIEYQEKLSQQKRGRKGKFKEVKEILKSGDISSNDDELNDGKPKKRKQATPVRMVASDEDATELVVQKKYRSRPEFSCPYCPEKYRVKSLLNSHVKLHESTLMQFSEICGENREKIQSAEPYLVKTTDMSGTEYSIIIASGVLPMQDDRLPSRTVNHALENQSETSDSVEFKGKSIDSSDDNQKGTLPQGKSTKAPIDNSDYAQDTVSRKVANVRVKSGSLLGLSQSLSGENATGENSQNKSNKENTLIIPSEVMTNEKVTADKTLRHDSGVVIKTHQIAELQSGCSRIVNDQDSLTLVNNHLSTLH